MAGTTLTVIVRIDEIRRGPVFPTVFIINWIHRVLVSGAASEISRSAVAFRDRASSQTGTACQARGY